MFRKITERLIEIERLIKEIRLVPVKKSQNLIVSGGSEGKNAHTLWSYYYGLGDYERSNNDTQEVSASKPPPA